MCYLIRVVYISRIDKIMFYLFFLLLNGQLVYKFTEASKWGRGRRTKGERRRGIQKSH